MAEEKLSRAVVRTRQALVSALLSGIEEAGFQKTTVNDLCERALVSRATFYTHFEDKYHLLRYAMENMSETLRRTATGQDDIGAQIKAMLDQIESRPRLFKNLFLDDSSFELQRMFSMSVVDRLAQLLEARQMAGELPEDISPTMLALFASGGMAHLITWWISGDMVTPKGEMIRDILAIFRMTGMPKVC